MKDAVYARVAQSDGSQAKMALQIQKCKDFIRAQGHDPVGIFTDSGVDGMSDERPGLDRLIEAAAYSRVERMVITEPVILARGAQTFERVRARLERVGLKVVLVTGEQLDDVVPARPVNDKAARAWGSADQF